MTYRKLKSYRMVLAKIKAFRLCLDEYDGLRAANPESAPRGGEPSKPTEKQALYIIGVKLKTEDELNEAIRTADEIREFIDGCPDETLKTFMQLRYYRGMPPLRAAMELGYTDCCYMIRRQSAYMKKDKNNF